MKLELEQMLIDKKETEIKILKLVNEFHNKYNVYEIEIILKNLNMENGRAMYYDCKLNVSFI